jgi:hypothetical protein
MLYRKSSPNPPTLLLRIVATAGAGALLGAAACRSSAPGSVPIVPSDSGSEAQGPCGGGGPCGTVVMPPDSGNEATVGGGVVVSPDSGADAHVPPDAGNEATVGGGVLVSPDSGADAHGLCNPVCGLLIRPEGGLD